MNQKFVSAIANQLNPHFLENGMNDTDNILKIWNDMRKLIDCLDYIVKVISIKLDLR